MRFLSPRPIQRSAVPALWALVFSIAMVCSLTGNPFLQGVVQAQDGGGQDGGGIVDAADIQSVMNEPVSEGQKAGSDQPSGIDLLSLITRGGWFMLPIGLASMLVVTLTVERSLRLRKNKVIPRRFVRELSELMKSPDQFSPSAAHALCKKYRSPAARVIHAMLMRTGQPLGEIERVGSETLQREADRYGSSVRWLSLAAAATPLMGLLGTVWGMIVAFHESSTLTADRSRSEQLSEGIYTALVTTLAGLIVAIPAAIFAQYLENKITKLFRRIDELAFNVAPGLLRFAGRSKLDFDGNLRPIEISPPPVNKSVSPPGSSKRGQGTPAPPPVASK